MAAGISRQEMKNCSACLQNVPRSRHLHRPQFGDVQTEAKTEKDNEDTMT